MKGKIFNAQEVQAILAGNKTMFREVIKPQPEFRNNYFYINNTGFSEKLFITECPYKVGQEIFCKESFAYIQDPEECRKEGEPCEIHYKADYDEEGLDKQDIKACGAEFLSASRMPQWVSRLTLRIKEIRVERVKEISEGEAKKEAVYIKYNDYFGEEQSFIEPFKRAWNATHKKPEHKFGASPWVWVIGFEVVKN